MRARESSVCSSVALQFSLLSWPRRVPGHGSSVRNRHDVHTGHLQTFDGGHASRSEATYGYAYCFVTSLDRPRTNADGRGLCRNVGSFACVFEAFDTARSYELRRSLGVRDGNDRVVWGHANVTDR